MRSVDHAAFSEGPRQAKRIIRLPGNSALHLITYSKLQDVLAGKSYEGHIFTAASGSALIVINEAQR